MYFLQFFASVLFTNTDTQNFFFIGLHKIDDTLIGTGAKEKLCVNDGRSMHIHMLTVVLHGEFNFRRTIFFALFVRAIYFLDGLGLRVNREKSVIFFLATPPYIPTLN